MGIWRFAGAFTVAQRQSECGSKTAKMNVSRQWPQACVELNSLREGHQSALFITLYVYLTFHDVEREFAAPLKTISNFNVQHHENHQRFYCYWSCHGKCCRFRPCVSVNKSNHSKPNRISFNLPKPNWNVSPGLPDIIPVNASSAKQEPCKQQRYCRAFVRPIMCFIPELLTKTFNLYLSSPVR